ncbi:MAG: DUF4338 domain-containing protein [Deltaproteobacteria bacterium]|nr:DUF4338 domain-containing protein [Deltaproteobacteria bacterium]
MERSAVVSAGERLELTKIRANGTSNKSMLPVPYSVDEEALRRDITSHLQSIALNGNRLGGAPSKEQIRYIHRLHREAARERIRLALGTRLGQFIEEIANGNEVCPEKMRPYLVEARSGTHTGDLFRFATLLWSIPVSQGYGRRLRFLVKDRTNGKLMGIFALGDPVFNLRARDAWIGWNQAARREKLVNLMDAYAVGAVPPYSYLLGGKLVTSLIASKEVADVFQERYGDREGIISGSRKAARLALVTVTSALGRSSMYNRLRLFANGENRSTNSPVVELVKVGTTMGYGHFQISDELFSRLREFLRETEHPYVDGHQFGNGPNWRIRLLRVGLESIGLNADHTLKHGIQREVYVMPIGSNSRAFLTGIDAELAFDRRSVEEISHLAKRRWVVPRAHRRPAYQQFRRDGLLGPDPQT